jgi:hypothetical protein
MLCIVLLAATASLLNRKPQPDYSVGGISK